MALENFVEQRKFEMMRNLHETSTISGFCGYVINEYDWKIIREISGDMNGELKENEIFNIFCLGFYRGRVYEKERYVEKSPRTAETIQGH